MRRTLILSILIAIASFFGTAAWAGPGCGATSMVQHIFDKADEDGDGALTQAEYEGAGLQEYGVSFADSDLDGDGVTSLDEYQRLYDQHHPSGDEFEV